MLTSPLVFGLVAGLSSALLFILSMNGAAVAGFAALLFSSALLPLFTIGFGFGIRGLLLAGAIGAGISAVILNVWVAAFYIIAIAAPAVLIGRLPLLWRAPDSNRPEAGVEWYPTGRIVLWAGGVAASVVFLALLALFGGTAEAYRFLTELLRLFLETEQGKALVPDTVDANSLAAFLAVLLPPTAASLWTLALLATLWLGAKIASALGWLHRPWPSFIDLEFPRTTALIFAGCVALSLIATGGLGLLAGLVSAGLLVGFVLLGLAAIHRWTAGVRNRLVILIAIYLALFLFPQAALFIAGFGFADNAFGLARRPSPPPSS